MDLQNYFDFIDDENIRIRGHRVYIDNVLSNYLWGEGPDELQQRYPQMSMEKIYATILYYLANKAEVDAYMVRVEKGRQERYQEWLQTVASDPEYIERRERLLKAREKWITEGKAILFGGKGTGCGHDFYLMRTSTLEVRVQLQKKHPEIEILVSEIREYPRSQRRDPVILEWIACNNYILVTNNRRTMPGHFGNHLKTGGHVPGILIFRKKYADSSNLGNVRDDLGGFGCRRVSQQDRVSSAVAIGSLPAVPFYRDVWKALPEPKRRNMDLQDYFDFIDDTSIRIKGHRVYIDEVLEEHLKGKAPEEILCCFKNLPLEKIYATLLYYEVNKTEMDAYLQRGETIP